MGVAAFVKLPDPLLKKNDRIENWRLIQIQVAVAIACKNQPVSIADYTHIAKTYKPQSRQQQPWHMAERGASCIQGRRYPPKRLRRCAR